jgi:hypothetical protein
MTYRGHVKGGVVVLDEPGSPEGTTVDIWPVAPPVSRQPRKESLSEVLTRFSGKAKGLPPDLSINHDHYLYGTPKRDEHE